MYDDYEVALDKSEIIICENCTHSNIINHKVLDRRGQKNHHISLEDPVFKKWKKVAVDLGCDLNEALKVIFYKIETGRDIHTILTNLNDNELLIEEEDGESILS